MTKKRLPRFVTIGVYGATAATFFDALERAGVDTFCDLRSRRGMRGADYAFVNSARLQKRLQAMGIHYLHFKELAPGKALRDAQAAADEAKRIARRKRTRLSDNFIAGYKRECLQHFNAAKFVERIGCTVKIVALFCVEREPAACHRSLLAERLEKDLGVEVVHLLPESGK